MSVLWGRPDVYTTAEIKELTGISYSTLRRWINRGVLTQPETYSDGRNGVHLVWSKRQLARVLEVKEKRQRGVAFDDC